MSLGELLRSSLGEALARLGSRLEEAGLGQPPAPGPRRGSRRRNSVCFAEMSRVGQFGQISTINDHLCLSGNGVLRPEKLKEKKITCIVNATTDEPSVHLAGVDYVKVRVEDSPAANLETYFDLVADKIRQTREAGGRTLVHCVAGVSRSATLCIVYLLKHCGLTLRQAYFHVKSARTIIHPNPGFWRQMIHYELRLRGRNTVRLKALADGGDIPDLYSEGRRQALPALNFRSASQGQGERDSHSARAHPSPLNGNSPRKADSAKAGAYERGGYRRVSPGPRASWASSRPSQPVLASHGPRLRSSPAHPPHRHSPASRPKGNLFSSLYDSHHHIFFPHL